MKLYQHDKKVWDTGKEVSRTWQFLIFRGKSLIKVNYQTPGSQYSTYGGLKILFGFFSPSPLGVNIYHKKFGLSVNLFTDHFEGWED